MELRARVVREDQYLDTEQEQNSLKGARYFALLGPAADNLEFAQPGEEIALVVARVPGPEDDEAMGPFAGPATIVCGHRNGDPFPEYASDIKALGERMGFELTEKDYPYRRSPEVSGKEKSSGPAPG